MNITKEIEVIANFARLELTDDEKQKFAGQLTNILGYFEMIQEVDTTDVVPTSHPLALVNVMRDDLVLTSLPRNEVLKNAPKIVADYFGVPPVIE